MTTTPPTRRTLIILCVRNKLKDISFYYDYSFHFPLHVIGHNKHSRNIVKGFLHLCCSSRFVSRLCGTYGCGIFLQWTLVGIHKFYVITYFKNVPTVFLQSNLLSAFSSPVIITPPLQPNPPFLLSLNQLR